MTKTTNKAPKGVSVGDKIKFVSVLEGTVDSISASGVTLRTESGTDFWLWEYAGERRIWEITERAALPVGTIVVFKDFTGKETAYVQTHTGYKNVITGHNTHLPNALANSVTDGSGRIVFSPVN